MDPIVYENPRGTRLQLSVRKAGDGYVWVYLPKDTTLPTLWTTETLLDYIRANDFHRIAA